MQNFSWSLSRKQCFCAFCKSPRRIYKKKNINLFNILACALGSALLMLALWQEFDPKVILLFVLFLAITETFLQLRWRLTVVCKQCGFDPVLYLKNSEAAAKKVCARLERRKSDPASMLAEPLKIPRISKQRSEEFLRAKDLADKIQTEGATRKGSLVSRQI